MQQLSFGDLLKRHRLAAGLTQEDLAERAELSPRAIMYLERSTRTPYRDTVRRLAEALDLAPPAQAAFAAAARARRTSSPDLAPHTLPSALLTSPTALLGREQEAARIGALLQRPPRAGSAAGPGLAAGARLLTLTGPGGVGKTRLALYAAATLHDRFAYGVCFVGLAALRDPVLVAATVAAALGLREEGGQPLVETLTAYLQDKQLLLVLDNFEHVLAAAPLVGTLLAAAPGLMVLVTSRTVLRLYGEQEVTVPPLAVPDLRRLPRLEVLAHYPAVALFVQRAQLVKPDFAVDDDSGPAVATICARLDGLPLAIELAAARVRLLPPRALLARLERASCSTPRLEVLTGGPRDVPARQQTLRNTIAWSYDLLETQEQLLFRRLSVFVGGCTPAAAEALYSAAGHETMDDGSSGSFIDVLAALIEKNLVTAQDAPSTPGPGWGTEEGEPRLAMLETIREFGLGCLTARGEVQATQHAHAAYYLTLAQAAEPQLTGAQQAVWLERLEQEHDNLRAALRWALEQGEAETALQLGGTLWRFWYLRGHLSEGRRWLEEALARGAGGMPAFRAKALNAAGVLAHYQGDYRPAALLCGESLALSRRLGDNMGIAAALQGLALVARSGGNYAAARAMYAEALPLLREAGDTWGMAYTLLYLGYAIWCQGDYEAARAPVEEALALYRTLGNKQGIANAFTTLGKVARDQGDHLAARTMHDTSLALFREIGDRHGLPRALHNVAQAAFDRGDYAAARAHYEESIAIFTEAGDRFFMTRCLEGLASVAAAQVQPAGAARLFGAAATVQEATGAPLPPGWRGDYERAMAATRAQLTEEAFARAWAEGRAMTPQQAVAALALAPMPEQDSACAQQPPSRSHGAATSPAGLTAREVEVLRLLAQGLSDAHIADKLVISRRTVNAHLRSIYGKLEVSTRSAATRYALDHKVV
jgi:predicted ATPase/DNA-binding CsgD family transcriptional regulator/transcriptional regulator with XRE-family HTH domain